MPLLELKNICFSYNSSSKDEPDFQLHDIHLTINNGEFISVLGPNGSGKSTLMKVISGLLKYSQGTISLEGKDYRSISRKALARAVAFVPQSSLTIFPFSVYEIVMMGRTPYLNMFGYEKKEDCDLVNEAIEMVDIAHLKNKGINEVSGGEAQRAFIARAIVQQPRLILLDEPDSHLDIKHQLSIFNLIRSLNEKKGLTVVTVSHDLNLAGSYSSRVVLMKDGRIVEDDRTAKILTKENIFKVFEVNSDIVIDNDSQRVSVVIKPGYGK
ncbi:MAG: ABC transporter ATP-binding protein [Ignavibacteria bacterium]|jgi:iron complex transport system ATP-binding protein|nr:ABC transporter ATP-binding protein [Ignavibacteria bacterium]MCU7501653.1 ABC transporter ATP-binding protein [Ignavibacteria bacterium]MCU7517758.1 ABC transporter ATP-binding protein [Ignavibacteria bacterium]